MTSSKTIFDEKEIAKLEGQVIWPHAFVGSLRERSRQFEPDLSNLYRAIFEDTMTLSIAVPPLPIVPVDTKKDACPMLANSTADSKAGPCLSIVVTTRNDDHSHRMRERTQSFIDNICLLANQIQRTVELVIVEWNPPADKPPLESAFSFPASHDFLSVVILTVDQETHNKFEMAKVTPLYQMIAKNVGIRRATGRFILATNIDVLFSHKLFTAMTDPDLKSGTMYRSHRCDINNNILDLDDPAEVLRQADAKALRVHYPEGPRGFGEKQAPTNSLYGDINQDDIQIEVCRDAATLTVATNYYFVGWHSLPPLHYQQCGDFQMLHCDDWRAMRGYMELDGFIFHLDSLLAINCHNAGITQHIFPDDCLHYHIDHKMGVEVLPGVYEAGSGKTLNHLSVYDLWGMDQYMAKNAGYCQYNDDGWGCAGAVIQVSNPTVSTRLGGDYVSYAKSESADPRSCLVEGSTAIGMNDGVYQIYLENARRSYALFSAYILDRYQGKKVWIWGAGGRGKHLFYVLMRAGVDVSGFISKDTDGGASLCSRPVVNSNAVALTDDIFVVVASIFADEIHASLCSKGFVEGQHFLVAP